MPPRKSNVSTTSAGDDGQGGGGTPLKERDGTNIEDLSLPRTMVQRLAKGVLPPNTMLNKDTVLAMQKSATVFINYLAAQANSTTLTNNRRTIPPTAVFDALKELEFEHFIPRVEAELAKFTEIQSSKRNDYRRKLKENKTEGGRPGSAGDGGEGGGDGEDNGIGVEADEDGQRQAKRMRVSEGEGGEGSFARNGDASPSDQLFATLTARAKEYMTPYEDNEDEEEEEEEEEEVEEEEIGDEGGVPVREREEEEEDGDEDDDDDDDADEYPDEGHRAESLEMEDPDEEERDRRRRFAYGPGGEGGGESTASGSEGGMDED